MCEFITHLNYNVCVYFTFRELLDDAPAPGGCCSKKKKLATQLIIYKAVGLEKQDRNGGTVFYISLSKDIWC